MVWLRRQTEGQEGAEQKWTTLTTWLNTPPVQRTTPSTSTARAAVGLPAASEATAFGAFMAAAGR